MIRIYQVLALLAAGTVIGGLFLPVVSIPFIGEMTFIKGQKEVAIVIMVISVLGAALALLKIQKASWITGILLLGIVAYSYFNFQDNFQKYDELFDNELTGYFYKSIKDSFKDSIDIVKGFWVILSGIFLFFVSAGIKS